MKINRVTARARAGAAGLLLLGPLAVWAQPPPDRGAPPNIVCAGPLENHFYRSLHGFPPGGPMPGFGHEWGAPAFLTGLKLTDEQQDKVFSILYAAAPALREQEKALRRAHEALRQLGTSADYDEARARSVVESATKAGGQLALLRLRTEHDIYAILTPEQRDRVVEHRQHDRSPGRGGEEK